MMAYFFGAISVACIAGAVLSVKRYGLRKGRGKVAADDALREIYGQYWTKVRELTQRRMLNAPSDEEWLAGIRARASASSGVLLRGHRAADAVPSAAAHPPQSVGNLRSSHHSSRRETIFRWVSRLTAAVAVLAASAAVFYFPHLASAALLIIVVATIIAWRLISVAGMIWQERAHVTAHCVHMDAAASSGAMLCERLPDGTTLLVMPDPSGQDRPPPTGTISNLREIEPL